MAEIETSVLRIGSNDLVLQDSAVRGSLAAAYSASSTYAVGDMVLKDGQLYECNTAITTAEAWTAAHWTAVTVGSALSDLKEDLESLQTDLAQTTAEALSAYVTDTASGAIASFPDGADNVPVKDLVVSIEPVQGGSGDPSPDNVRPISGHTQAVVTRTGVNVWDEEWELGVWNGSGEKVPSNTAIRSKNYIPVMPNTEYYWKFAARYTSGLIIRELDKNKGFLTTTTKETSGTFTTSSGCYFIVLCSYGSDNITTYQNDISINYPSTDHDYHAYDGQTYTISLDGTVYGGTLDVTTGVLTVDRAMVDMGTLTWILNGGYFKSSSLDSIIKRPVSNTEVPQVICSIYYPVNWNTTADKSVSVLPTTGSAHNIFLWVKDSSYTDAESFTTAMNGVQLCYTLATPFEVQLTAEDDITTLKGQNNIWADCGDTTVEYRADTKLYINKMLNA